MTDIATLRAVAVVAAQTAVVILVYRRVVKAIHCIGRPSADAYSEGHEAGYDKGWREGRRSRSLAVVKMHRKDQDALG